MYLLACIDVYMLLLLAATYSVDWPLRRSFLPAMLPGPLHSPKAPCTFIGFRVLGFRVSGFRVRVLGFRVLGIRV